MSPVGDYDNDGWPDSFIANTGKNTLYHNNGNGTFTDVTDESGLGRNRPTLSACRPPGSTTTTTACSIWLYRITPNGRRKKTVAASVAMWMCTAVLGPTSACRNSSITIWARASSKTSRKSPGLALLRGKGMGIGIADFNDDGWMDVFIANDTEPNFLF